MNLKKNYRTIPQELKECKQWICHSNKIPKSPLYNGNADPTAPETWGTFEQAVQALERYGYTGIGFVFTSNTSYCGIDIDHCINQDTGEINPKALDIINTMSSYTELSPSGTGVHIIYKGNVHSDWKKKINNALGDGVHLEMYQEKRYFTVTGNPYGTETRITDSDIQAQKVYQTYAKPLESICCAIPFYNDERHTNNLSDESIIRLASRHNHKFARLFKGDLSDYGGDESRAEMAFCSILAFYTKESEQIDRIYRKSGLLRSKWDRPTAGSTYGKITAEKALQTVTNQYTPQYYSKHSDEPLFTDTNDSETSTNDSETSDTFQMKIPEFTFEELKSHPLDNIKTAEWFADCVKDYAVFVSENKCWFVYCGTHWKEDLNNLTMRMLAKIFIENCIKAVPPPIPIPENAGAEEKKAIQDQNKIYIRYWNHYKNFTYLNSRISLIRDMEDILQRNINEFDSKPYLFNCQNGTFNLNTMQLQPHHPNDSITMIANAVYDPQAYSDRFIRFLNEITENSSEKAKYLQKALGYSIDGEPREECFFLALGLSTRNGKGTLFNTVLNLLGDYGVPISFDTLSRKGAKDGSKPTPDIAILKAARFVLANEPDKGVYFDEALLKQLTGGDPITTRKLYGLPFSFIPQFKIWITANNKPNVSDNSIFESDRLKLIGFNRHFGENERDTDLKATLKQETEKSAILNWLIEGYQLYKKEGLKNYSEMNEQLRHYSQDNDIIQQYIDNRLSFPENMPHKDSVTLKAIRCDYVTWCRLQNISPISQRSFKEEMLKHNVYVFVYHKQDSVCCKINPIQNMED